MVAVPVSPHGVEEAVGEGCAQDEHRSAGGEGVEGDLAEAEVVEGDIVEGQLQVQQSRSVGGGEGVQARQRTANDAEGVRNGVDGDARQNQSPQTWVEGEVTAASMCMERSQMLTGRQRRAGPAGWKKKAETGALTAVVEARQSSSGRHARRQTSRRKAL